MDHDPAQPSSQPLADQPANLAQGNTAVENTTPPPKLFSAAASAPTNELFFNRELSWLDFNERVLELAEDGNVPLLERARFLAIFASNLDEFFMKRVGGLQRQLQARVTKRTIDGLSPDEQLDLIHEAVRPLLRRQVECWFSQVHPQLKKAGVKVISYGDLNASDKAAADNFFRRNVFSILTPLAVDSGHPFPFISNLSNSLGVMLRSLAGESSFIRIKLPENLPRWVPMALDESGEKPLQRFVPLEGIVGGNLASLFPGMELVESHLFRVTRNADVESDEEDADDLLAMVEQELKQRRMASVVRLEIPKAMSESMGKLISNGLHVPSEDVYRLDGPIDMNDLMSLAGSAGKPELEFEPWTPLVPPRLSDDDADIFSVIRQGDLLVHHPYESFSNSVERFVTEAAADPSVLAIKMTLYRTSRDSAFVPALIRAAEEGKQVAVLVELKARFDEQRNVELAQRLEKAGVHVVYGVVGFKTHTKLTMAVREELDGRETRLRTYCHIGTGNYNSRTATLYTDVGLFTCDDELTGDVVELFHSLTGRSMHRGYRKLLVAPVNMRDRFLESIEAETQAARLGQPAKISAKMNQLQDDRIIRALYDASQAGVKIDLCVRGFCCLRPGVPGMSENIRVISILGRFLEHSRIFRFHNGGAPTYFIGSADWMVRNLDYRVEAITPVDDPSATAELDIILDLAFEAGEHVWQLGPDGTWSPRTDSDHGDYQQRLMQRYLERHEQGRGRL